MVSVHSHWQAWCQAMGVLCISLLPLSCQAAAGKPAMVLVHGSSGGGYSFEYPQPELGAPKGVKGLFENAGYNVFNPSLPYHNGPSDAYSISDGPVTAEDYAQSLAGVFLENDLRDASVVCHSAGGAWCQILYAMVPERIARFVYIDAYVVLPGNSFLTTQAELTASDPVAISVLIDPLSVFYPSQKISLYEWREHLVQTRSNDTAFVQRTFDDLVPEPMQPLTDKLNVTAFVSTPVAKAMVYLTQDFLYGIHQPDLNAFLFFADRLHALPNGGIPFKMFNLSADHLCFLTRPIESAQVILEAVEYLGG